MHTPPAPGLPGDDFSTQTRRAVLAGGVAGAGALGVGLLSPSPSEAQVLPPDERYVWRERMPVNVKDHGAEGDGSTDDKAAIQAAIDAVEADGGGTVFFPPGDYVLDSGLTVDASKPMRLHGSGMAMMGGTAAPSGFPTRLRRRNGTATMLTVAGTSFGVRGWIEISDIGFHGGDAQGHGIFLDRCQNSYLHRLRIANCGHTALHLRQVFNSSGDNLFIHNSGSGTTHPAMLMDAHAESQGGSDTVHFTNIEFEGNHGTDLRMTGNAANVAPTSAVYFANVKMESANIPDQAFPFIDLPYAQNCMFVNVSVHVKYRTVTPVQENRANSGTFANKFSNMIVSFGTNPTPRPDYAFQLSQGSQQLSNITVIGGEGPQVAAVRVDSSVAAGRLQISNLLTNLGKAIEDARANPEFLMTEVVDALARSHGGTAAQTSGPANALVIDFDPSTVENWLCEVPIPRRVLGGRTATVRLVWTVSSSTTGNVVWRVHSRASKAPSGGESNASLNVYAASPQAVPAAGWTATTDIQTATVFPGHATFLRIERNATDPNDTAPVDARLISAQLLLPAQ